MLELSPELMEDFVQFSLYFFVFLILLWLGLSYTVYKTLSLVKKENQVILPSQVWFMAVPLFNMFWNFEVVRRLSYSLNNEFYDRKVAVEELPTLKPGQWYAWSFLVFYIPFLPAFVRLAALIICIIYFFAYWYAVAQFKSLMEDHNRWSERNKTKKHEGS